MGSHHNSFSLNYNEIILEEIGLGGLDGIGLDFLWKRVQKRINSTVTEKMKSRFWSFIVSYGSIFLYKVPEPVIKIEVIDRFMVIDELTGQLADPVDYLDGPYEFHPIESVYGSCKFYHTRVLIPDSQLQHMPYNEVFEEYGNYLVMVASPEERWRALAPQMPFSYISHLNNLQYCILELVGRGRENGQMTVGKTNLSNLVKDSKGIFYNRKILNHLDLIKVQYVTQIVKGKGLKSLLLRLNKFYQPWIKCLPQTGWLNNIVKYLLKQPNFVEKKEVLIEKGFLTLNQCKRFKKSTNILKFEQTLEGTKSRLGSKKKKDNHVLYGKRKFITLADSEGSSQSDEETNEPLKCRYKIGINLLRQAYERLLDAGLKGLTQVELSQLLGIEFYTGRTICRLLKGKKIVREFVEDKGKLRTRRYIAIAATGKMHDIYDKEHKKLLENYSQTSKQCKKNLIQPTVAEDSVTQAHANNTIVKNETDTVDMEEVATEVKVLDGLENFNKPLLDKKKSLTLKQLKVVNGLIKVVNQKVSITGYHNLSHLISKEINQPPMDTKALKTFIQKLAADKQLKLIKVKWPNSGQRFSIFICAPHVKCTDSIIKTKYKEICLRAMTCNKRKTNRDTPENTVKCFKRFALPRYMKIQKMHEFVYNFAYNNMGSRMLDMPEGFVSVVDMLPEMTVEFALNNTNDKLSSIKGRITLDVLQLKMRNAPSYIRDPLMQSKSLQNTIRFNLKVLALLGLIQLIYQPDIKSGRLTSFVFFVNRHSKILNTVGNWPRLNFDVKSLEKSYYFKTFKNVEEYWETVYEISINTKMRIANREQKSINPPMRLESDVKKYDNGDRYGDNKGPCGFDSCFYMEIPHLWNHAFIGPIKRLPQIKNEIKIPIIRKRRIRKPTKKPITKPTLAKVKPLSRKRCYDGSIKWSKEEDRIIMLCKAAITIMSPSSQPGSLKIRNIVMKDILSMNDSCKVQMPCFKRALALDSNSSIVYEKECLLNEMRRRRNLTQKYEGLLRKLRLRYSGNMSTYLHEGRVVMLELVWLLNQVIQSKNYTKRRPCAALNIEDFHTKYTIDSTTANKSCNIYHLPENMTLKEAIILTVMLSFKNDLSKEVSIRIYSIFKVYSEKTLREAIDILRKSGIIAAKEKNYQNFGLDIDDIVQTTFKISMPYQRRWICRLNSNFVDDLVAVLGSNTPHGGAKGSPEINCMCMELYACNLLEIMSARIPVIISTCGSLIKEEQLNAIDIETKFKLNSGTLTWKYKGNSSSMIEQFKCTNVNVYLEALAKNSVIIRLNDEAYELNSDIVRHLKNKNNDGATFLEIKNTYGYKTEKLIKILDELESKNLIKRVGFQENIIVLTNKIESWSIKIDDTYIIPMPWLTLDSEMNIEIFLKWASVVMNKVFERPGCSISHLIDSCECLSGRGIQDICMFLQKYECAKLNIMHYSEPDLFSEDDDIPELCEFNKYDSMQNILVFPTKNCLTQFALLKKSLIKYV